MILEVSIFDKIVTLGRVTRTEHRKALGVVATLCSFGCWLGRNVYFVRVHQFV